MAREVRSGCWSGDSLANWESPASPSCEGVTEPRETANWNSHTDSWPSIRQRTPAASDGRQRISSAVGVRWSSCNSAASVSSKLPPVHCSVLQGNL